MARPAKPSTARLVADLLFSQRRILLGVVLLSLLSTSASLVEPLVYREAINDISGLFVRKATLEAQQAAADSTAVDSDADAVAPDSDALIVRQPHSRTTIAARTPAQAVETLLWAVAIIFAINVFGHAVQWLGENLNLQLACRIEQNFIQRTFTHVLRMPLGFFGKRSSAALGKQINQSEEVSAIVNGFSQQILPELISLLGILAIMLYQNVTLSLISVAVIPVYLLVAWRSANKLEVGLGSYYERWEEVSTRMQDALGGIKTVKLSGAEEQEVLKFKNTSSLAYAEYMQRNRLANKYIFWESFLTRVAGALVLGYGGYLTLENQLTPGDVVMFVAYLDRLYDPIDQLATLWVNLQQNLASITRAFTLLHSGKEEQHGNLIHINTGQIEFKKVSFSYTPQKQALRDISFSIQPGKITALVGPSGAGKTTTVDLLMKLYAPVAGQIFIDGQDISSADPSSVRAQIGMVSADGMIFRGTLADNIRYKKPDASDEEVLRAAQEAGLGATLKRLPEGLQTPVGESGFGLSVGERQRIQIARVLVARPKILILDEATANLDYATEAEVKKTIMTLGKAHTVLIIAHRFSMIRNADYIIVLQDGAILEKGTLPQLIQQNGWVAGFARAAEEGNAA